MKSKMIDKLSVKVVGLTFLLASMTLFSAFAGITSLSDFKGEYHQVRSENFNLLLKMSEFKTHIDDLVHISAEMLLTDSLDDLQWYELDAADQRLIIDKLLTDLPINDDQYQQLSTLKLSLYAQLDEISRELNKKHTYAQRFEKSFQDAVTLKGDAFKSGNVALYTLLDNALVALKGSGNADDKQLSLHKLGDYINTINADSDIQLLHKLRPLFLTPAVLIASQENYQQQKQVIVRLRLQNDALCGQLSTLINDRLGYVQQHFFDRLSNLENTLKQRKQRLYLVMFCCLLVTLFLVLIQLDFIARIELIRKVIKAGDSGGKMHFPITGKDEISKMALSVNSYVQQLMIKKQEIISANTRLQYLAEHDPLTTIYNRRCFEGFLVSEHQRYQRYKEKYCLAMIDIDLFKAVNDSHGHDAGDQVLIEFTRRVQQVIRKVDIFARYGGEEFVLLMPNTSKSSAYMMMERIRTEIDKAPYEYKGRLIAFTVSIGMSEVQAQAINHEDALVQLTYADSALYKSKHAGRNRVNVYIKKKIEEDSTNTINWRFSQATC